MNPVLRRMLLLALAPLVCAQTTGTVEGTVVNSITKEPIAGLEVEARGLKAPYPSYRATTGVAGAFQIKDVAEGEYMLLFTREAYLMGRISGDARHFRITPRAVARFDIELEPFGKLRGRVLDNEGRPVPKSRVEIAHLRGGSGDIAKTDDQGRFELTGSGTFTLMARPADGMKPPPPLEDQRAGWAATWYPRAVRHADAERIVLRPGAELDGFDLRLLALPVYHIRGTVRNEDGKPDAGIAVKLAAPDRWNQFAEEQAVSGKDGAFDFPSVWPRDWELLVEVRNANTVLRGFASTTVSRADVEGLTVRLSPPFTLTGSVEFAGAPETKLDSSLYVVLLPEMGEGFADGTVQPDRSLQIKDVFPGRYRFISAGPAPGFYLDSVFLGTRDVTGQPLDLYDASAPLRVVFKPSPARISGSVENCAGRTVGLWQLDDPILESEWHHEKACDASGHFDFSNLRPGEYYAYAFESIGDQYLLQDLNFARALRNRATSVHVNAGESAAIELKLAPWPE